MRIILKHNYYLIWFWFLTLNFAQDTFSIVAVDTNTMEIGSAGASCIAGSIMISDIIPGTGAIHTQSYWNQANQNNAHNWMVQSYTPDEIINLLENNDAQNNPSIRQYGITALLDSNRSAAYTGSNCYDYKNHILGPNYAIQGNILSGQDVLDNMEMNFLTTEGSLSVKLMAALQGANMSGADSRCSQYGTSSLSAFIRMAEANDDPESLYLHLNVNSVVPGIEPIDSLQVLFDSWYAAVQPFTPGDVNRDGILGIIDVLKILDFAMNLSEPTYMESWPADYDGNGTININDAFGLIYAILEID